MCIRDRFPRPYCEPCPLWPLKPAFLVKVDSRRHGNATRKTRVANLTSGSNRPLLAPPAPIPEHPLVARCRHEMISDFRFLTKAQSFTDTLGEHQYRTDYCSELIASVRVDPPLVKGIGRTVSDERLAHLPIDPVARKHRPPGFCERASTCRR